MNAIEVKNLNKSFKLGKNDEVKVLKSLNFTVKKGSFLSIMGPSGCGKSTLLYLLGGLDNPTSGVININGRDISTLKEKEKAKMKRREVGFVFQFYNLVPNLTIEDNILLPLLMDGKKIKNYKEDLNNILDLVGLKDKRKMTPRELSGGQQQRVAIARALLFKPEIILADEPIGNLDSKTGESIMELFREINKKFGTTIVQVTHAESAAYYGDYYNNNGANWVFYFMPEGGNGDMVQIDANAGVTGIASDISGTYHCSSSAEHYSFLPGEYYGGYFLGSWYLQMKNGAVDTEGEYAAFMDGTLVVTKNADDSYSFELEAFDANTTPFCITMSFTGKLTIADYSIPGASMMKKGF